jgi:Na+(H+)/acetate symporter ActP
MPDSGARTGGGDRLSHICGIGGLGILVAIVLFVLAERAGLPRELVAAFLALSALAIGACAAAASRAADLPDYLVAGRCVPALFAGAAAGAEWAGIAIVLSVAGSLFLAGHDGHMAVLALTAGYALMAVLFAPFLRNVSTATLPEFIGIRFGGFARAVAVTVLIACTLPISIALIQTAMLAIVRGFGLDAPTALYVVATMLAVCVLPGGMRGVIAAQVAQFAVLLIGAVALFVMVEAQRFDAPAGASYDPLVQAFAALARGMGLSTSASPRSIPFNARDALGSLELVLCLMLGTACLPHLLVRSAATRSTREARLTPAWSLVFVAVLVLTLPTFFALLSDDTTRDKSGVLHGLVTALELTALLAAASSVMLALANALGHDVWDKLVSAKARARLILARIGFAAAIALAAYGAAILPPEPRAMTAWGFSLAAAGFFPALALGIWWQRTTAPAAAVGMAAGAGLALFYIVVSRYFPQVGVTQFGMSSLLDSAGRAPIANVAQVLADPRWLADVPAGIGNPLASNVGWFNVSNLAAGIFGVPMGFLVAIVLSLPGKRPSPDRQAVLNTVRAPADARVPGRN